MAKRRRRKHSSKCPEPFNTLLDLAGGFAMGAVASHMEKKYNYSKKGKINPYSVSALGIATGRMKTTEDIIRTGATLGAMGSFDVDSDDTYSHSIRKPDDSVFQQIREPKRNDNRYAWRLNCEDGSSYGISPYDYETRSEYSEAIQNAKQCNQQRKNTKQSTMTGSARLDGSEVQFLFVRVSRLDIILFHQILFLALMFIKFSILFLGYFNHFSLCGKLVNFLFFQFVFLLKKQKFS